ncbi:MAG: PEP-CTERM sorting domain-containing protein [Burkholderiales bacterium]|jgi:hypothetical protein|nr:PEP-CTERM sorting domain-containing protein [Burkholderiales bacterium]
MPPLPTGATPRPATDVIVRAHGDGLELEQPRSGRRFVLDAADARLWRALDGRRGVQALAADLGVSAESLWRALDALADAGLLDARAAPPTGGAVAGGMRRRFLSRAMPVLAAAAAPGLARARTNGDDEDDRGESNSKKSIERNDKRDAEAKDKRDADAIDKIAEREERDRKQQEQGDKQAAAAPKEQGDKHVAEAQDKGERETKTSNSNERIRKQLETDVKGAETRFKEAGGKNPAEQATKNAAEALARNNATEQAAKNVGELMGKGGGGGVGPVIPEPSTIVVLGLGMAGLAAKRLRADRPAGPVGSPDAGAATEDEDPTAP